MAGHNKWSQIKHKKAKEDSKRGAAFTKLSKEITVAAKSGGGDPSGNPRLRLLIDKAKEINMPLENITRAIKKGTGELPGVSYEAFTYEGYGPHNIAVMVDTLSDNKNRTVAEFRRLFTENGGNLGESGSVGWMFDRSGVIKVKNAKITEDELLEHLLAYDIKDIQMNDYVEIFCETKSIEPIRQALTNLGLTIESAEIEWVPKNPIKLTDEEMEKVLAFLSELQDHDDVQNVYANMS